MLLFANQEFAADQAEIALSVPVESYEHYENWLTGVAEAAGMPRFRLIDEPSAAALGYGAHIQPGNVYLMFDFGGGTMHAALILIEEVLGAGSGRRCRVLAKAGADVGGMTLDQWLYEEVLRRSGLSDADAAVRRASRSLLQQCEAAKERLSFADEATITVPDLDLARPNDTGRVRGTARPARPLRPGRPGASAACWRRAATWGTRRTTSAPC